MFEKLLTEQPYPPSEHLDRLATTEILRVMNTADAEVAAAVGQEIPRIAAAADAIFEALSRGGHLIYIGAGTSGRLGVLDASECPPTFNVPADLVRGIIAGGDQALVRAIEDVEDDRAAGARDVIASGFGSADVLVGISASGRTPYVLGAVAQARDSGGIACGISCTPGSELSRSVDYPIEPAPGPEILTGSTRLRAGTATKMVLNMISTSVMVRLGHVYGNLMVNVQSSNRKLQDRALRVLQKATGLTREKAAELLEQAGRDVRTGIVMQKRNVTRAEAERLLAAAGGRVAAVLDSPALK